MIGEQLPPGLAGVPVFRSWSVPGDRVLVAADLGMRGDAMTLLVHPWFDLQRCEYRPPFYTRCSLGEREARRDRRRYPRRRS